MVVCRFSGYEAQLMRELRAIIKKPLQSIDLQGFC